ncbi:MAG TPA: hypothetical protein VK324_04395 [Tepidisphaeraceae bacterium]|nr:hypothetical protein [Tepidisphaeraceae bacterium]
MPGTVRYDVEETVWPDWWSWELELTPHLLKRMIDRGFNEVDLRTMLQSAERLRPDHEPGRFVVTCRLRRRAWEVIVKPADNVLGSV